MRSRHSMKKNKRLRFKDTFQITTFKFYSCKQEIWRKLNSIHISHCWLMISSLLVFDDITSIYLFIDDWQIVIDYFLQVYTWCAFLFYWSWSLSCGIKCNFNYHTCLFPSHILYYVMDLRVSFLSSNIFKLFSRWMFRISSRKLNSPLEI